MKTTLVVFLCLAYVIICDSQITDPVPAGFDWCDPDLCPTGLPQHIACKNSGKFAPTCVNPNTFPISAKCQQAILNAHNMYRARVASGKVASTWPKANRMMKMQYDTMLAGIASLNCMTCVFAHDKCRSTDTYLLAGQNLGIEYSSGAQPFDCVTFVNNRIKSWYNEINYLPVDVITAYRSSLSDDDQGYGHATTLLTDRSHKVGCSICQFQSVRNGMLVNSTELACNYASSNVRTYNVFKMGLSAKGCITGGDLAYPGLCSINENKNYNPNILTQGENGEEFIWPDDF